MYHYLLVDTNVPQSANPSKLKFQFVGVQTLLHCNEHNYFIWNAIEVNKHLMENLFDKLSNGSSLTSRLRWECLKTIRTSHRNFYQELHHRHRLDIHPWDPGPSWSMPQGDEEHLKEALGRPPPWPPP
jgi:hypothetical protein